MIIKRPQLFKVIGVFLTVFLLGLSVTAQYDPNTDPNSPTPVLLSADDSVRALAVPVSRSGRVNGAKLGVNTFAPDSKINLYITNISLIDGEGANAFRLYAVDAKGRRYRFPVLDLQSVKGREWIYALTVQIRDELGFWDPPTADGDLLIYVTWRGLTSNNLRLGFGQTGGGIRDNENTIAAPISKFLTGPAKNGNPAADYVGPRFSGDRIRFLEQATFGPTVGLDQRIRRIGLRTWLAEQFDISYPSVGNLYPNQPLRPTNPQANCDDDPPDSPVTCYRDTYTMYEPQAWFFREAFYGDPQLRHRVAWALAQLWVTSGIKIQQGRHMVEYHKILSANAFGNYRTLMKQMTLSPAMGDYLDMAQSIKDEPNENYGRELMQLFSIGLFMLNQDGTLQMSGGRPVPTYNQNVVSNLAKVLTGWSFCSQQASCPNIAVGTVNYIDPMILTPNNHDLTSKTLLSYPGSTTTNVAACSNCTNAANITTYANNSLDQTLDNIFNHPNVAPFVSKYLIQHLVTSDPTPAYIGRISAVFRNNGLGVRGDLKAVVRAILLDPEARGDVKTDPNFGKLREPVQLLTNLARSFNVRGAGGAPRSDGVVAGDTGSLGQDVFYTPSVFNFYPPGFIVPGTMLLGPEFALMNTNTTARRENVCFDYIFNQIDVNNPDRPFGTSLDFTEMRSLAAADSTGNLLVNTLNQRMLHGTMSAQMKSSILTAVSVVPASDPLLRAKQAIYLIATSSQFQVQR